MRGGERGRVFTFWTGAGLGLGLSESFGLPFEVLGLFKKRHSGYIRGNERPEKQQQLREASSGLITTGV